MGLTELAYFLDNSLHSSFSFYATKANFKLSLPLSKKPPKIKKKLINELNKSYNEKNQNNLNTNKNVQQNDDKKLYSDLITGKIKID